MMCVWCSTGITHEHQSTHSHAPDRPRQPRSQTPCELPIPSTVNMFFSVKKQATIIYNYGRQFDTLETAPNTTFHTLVVTGADPVPIQMVTVNGQSVNIRRANLQTIHEEADIIVVQQATNVSQAGGTGVQITVRADETDIFVFLFHLYDTLDCSSTM